MSNTPLSKTAHGAFQILLKFKIKGAILVHYKQACALNQRSKPIGESILPECLGIHPLSE